MAPLDRYLAERAVVKALNQRVMTSCLRREALARAGTLLGLLDGDRLLLWSEEELSAVMVVALHDLRPGGKNAFERYRETLGARDAAERAALDALIASSISRYRVRDVAPTEGMLLVKDILTPGAVLPLLDIGLSRSVAPGMLLCFRLVRLAAVSMTSGVVFAFPGTARQALLRRRRELARELRAEGETVLRFVAFFQASRTQGLEVGYAELPG